MAGYGLAALLGWGGGAVLLAVWAVGGSGAPSLSSCWGLTVTLATLLATLATVGLLRPLRGLAGTGDLVRRLEARGAHANLLVAAEESLRRPDRWDDGTGVRAELRRRVRERAAGHLAHLGPADVVTVPWRRAHLAAVLATVAATAVLVVLAPDTLRRGGGRLAAPWTAAPPTPTAGILTLPAESWVVAGSTVDLQALDLAGGDGAAVCEVRRGAGLWQPVGARLERNWGQEPARVWSARLDDVREDLSWRFRRGTIVSRSRQLTVRDHPLLTELAAVVTPPAYTRVEPRTLDRLPSWIEVPAGSRVALRGRANADLRTATLVTDDDSTALSVDGAVVAGGLAVDRDLAFRVHVRDVWGLENAAPVRYEIAAAADQAPAVALQRPDDDGLLPLAGTLNLVLDAADDYGLDELRLLGRAGGDGDWSGGALALAEPGTWSEHPLGDGVLRARLTPLDGHDLPLRARVGIEVEVGRLRLVPGDALELVAEAVDNRRPGPAGVGRSRVLRLQAPSPSDVLAQKDEAQEDRRSELVEARRRGRELDADLDRLTRELLKNPVPDWGRQQEMEEAVRRQATLQNELSRIADQLQQQLEDLASGQLTSREQLERADEVAALLEQGADRQSAELLRKLAEQGDQVDPQDLTRAFQDAARAQKDLARRLDAALSMMDRMAREQQMESMTSLLEQMLRRQQELADQSRDLAQQQDGEQTQGEQQQGDQQQGEQKQGEQKQGDKQQGDQQQGDQQQGDQAKPGESDPGERDAAAPDPGELARRQEALARELEDLRDRLAEAVEQMKQKQQDGQQSPGDQQAAEQLQQALQDLEKRMQQNSMDQAAQQLAQLDPQTAAKLQEQAMRDLGSLYHVLLQTQQAMQAAMQMNQVSSLRGLAADLLAVSDRQETIADQVPSRLRDVRSTDLTRRQHRLENAVISVRDNLAKLMDESPQRIIKLLEKLDGVIEEMGEGVRALEAGQAAVAQRHTRESLAQTNRTIIGLLTEANMNAQGSGGGQSSSQPSDAAQQLQDLAREQARLNGVTDELRQMLADRGLSQKVRSQMQRLGQEQGEQAARVRELEEQERVRPDGERLLGDLGAMADDLESIGKDLGGGLVDEQTLVRQERILSRMLDARNAARRRDYSNRRESRTADRLFGENGLDGPVAGAPEQQRSRLRYQALEKAPLEYRDLVRRYFAGLDSLRRLDPPPVSGPGTGDVP